MNTAESVYRGALRTQSTHIRSKETLVTDAPVDNNGKGEAFSPTDLIATGLLTCMITVIGIHAEKNDFNLGKVTGSVKKIMVDLPRRIGQLNVEITFERDSLSPTQRKVLENIAIHCPVAKSLHPEIIQNTKFIYR